MRELTDEEKHEEELYRRQLKWTHGYSYQEVTVSDTPVFFKENKQRKEGEHASW